MNKDFYGGGISEVIFIPMTAIEQMQLTDCKEILQQWMDDAVEEERYEDAAKFRDRLNELR